LLRNLLINIEKSETASACNRLIRNRGQVIAKTGGWKIVASHADGVSCILAAGQCWTNNPEYAQVFGERVGYK
jgi:hypothetical protein